MKTGLFRLVVHVSFLFFLCFLLRGMAQDPVQIPAGIPVESEWVYGKHLEVVEGIMKLPLGDREGRLDGFMKAVNPKAKIVQYFPAFYSQIADEYKKAGQNDKADALTAKMTKLFPNLEGPEKKMAKAYQAKNFAEAITLGEQIYASKPDGQIAAVLAECYIATNNSAKAAEYAPKALETLGPEKGIGLVAWLGEYYFTQKNMDKAVEYYNLLLQTYPNNPPAGWTAEQWNPKKVGAYSAKMTAAYQKKDFAGAVQNGAEAVKIYPQNDYVYFLMGRSQWQLQDLEKAMDSFAKAVVIGKSFAAKSREYLEQIYKPRNKGTLDGLDNLLNKAKAELQL
jgi:tetratricopeptide (TPR) repeat protein